MGEAFPVVPILDVTDDPEFWAIAESTDDAFSIRVSTGTVDGTSTLWSSAFDDEDFAGTFVQAVGSDVEAMTHISLVWLILHEMHHFQMGHFKIHSRTKAGDLEGLGLVTRTAKRTATGVETSLTLEMQADHDATEMLLDAYSPEEWLSLRARTAAIAAIMVLIERTEAAHQVSYKTHPKAATRIFQLLGHVFDMPTLLIHLERHQNTGEKPHRVMPPAQSEQECFAEKVLLPVFFDAVSLARIANAQSIIDDLGSAIDFFNDVRAVKLDHGPAPNRLVSVGAQQWAELAAEGRAKMS